MKALDSIQITTSEGATITPHVDSVDKVTQTSLQPSVTIPYNGYFMVSTSPFTDFVVIDKYHFKANEIYELATYEKNSYLLNAIKPGSWLKERTQNDTGFGIIIDVYTGDKGITIKFIAYDHIWAGGSLVIYEADTTVNVSWHIT